MNHDLVPNSLATGAQCLFFISVNGRVRPHCTRSIDIDFRVRYNNISSNLEYVQTLLAILRSLALSNLVVCLAHVQ